MLKHPLLPVLVGYAGGVVMAVFVPIPLVFSFLLAFALAFAALVWERRRPWLLVALLFLAGVVNLTVRTTTLAPHDLRRLLDAEPHLATVRGRLVATPELRVSTVGNQESVRSRAVLDVTALGRDGCWQAAAGRVAVSTPAVLGGEFFGGRAVEVFGVIRPPGPPRAPGLFDARPYFAWQGIHFQLETRDTNDWRLAADAVQPARPPLADRFIAWAQRTLARGLPVEDEALRLRWAMTLGWRTALTDEVSAPFMYTGTMHIFAISGLHIALMAGTLVAVLRVLQVPRAATGLIALPLLWFYTAATGWQASAVRSTIMMSVVIGGWALQRPGDLLNSLAGAALVILLWEPRQLFQASFQLSFSVVLSMALLAPPLIRVRDRWLRSDPLLPAELLPRWRRWLDPPLRFLTSSLVISFAAWMGSLPLIAWYFHLLTPVSLLANMAIVPLASLCLMCDLGALTGGDWLPGLTGLFNHAGWFWMVSMVRISEWAAALPGAYRWVPAWGALWTAAWYAALLAVGSGWLTQPGRRLWAAGVPLGLAVIAGATSLAHRGTTTLTVVPLNGGHAIWVDAPGRGEDLLVDCGSAFALERVVLPFLHAQGVNRLPHFALSHGDARHTGGASLLASNTAPVRIWTSLVAFRSPSYCEFVKDLDRGDSRWNRVCRGDTLAGWQVLHPNASDAFTQADDNALMLRRAIGGCRVLLLSDLGREGQRTLLPSQADLNADIVVAGLPAQNEPLSDALLDAIQPRLIVLADDRSPTSARTSARVRARLLRRGVPVVFQSDEGAVVLTFRRGTWRAETMTGRVIRSGQPGG